MPDEHIVVGCVQMNVYNTCSSGRVESVSVSECFDLETAKMDGTFGFAKTTYQQQDDQSRSRASLAFTIKPFSHAC